MIGVLDTGPGDLACYAGEFMATRVKHWQEEREDRPARWVIITTLKIWVWWTGKAEFCLDGAAVQQGEISYRRMIDADAYGEELTPGDDCAWCADRLEDWQAQYKARIGVFCALGGLRAKTTPSEKPITRAVWDEMVWRVDDWVENSPCYDDGPPCAKTSLSTARMFWQFCDPELRTCQYVDMGSPPITLTPATKESMIVFDRWLSPGENDALRQYVIDHRPLSSAQAKERTVLKAVLEEPDRRASAYTQPLTKRDRRRMQRAG